MGVPDFMEGFLKPYEIGDPGPPFSLDTGAYLSTYVNTVKEGGKPISRSCEEGATASLFLCPWCEGECVRVRGCLRTFSSIQFFIACDSKLETT